MREAGVTWSRRRVLVGGIRAPARSARLLGDALLVAPVFAADGTVEYYVPEGTWTRLLDGGEHAETFAGPRWITEKHGFDSLRLLVRPGSVLPVGAGTHRPDYAWADGVTLRCFELPERYDTVVTVPGGEDAPATSACGATATPSSRRATTRRATGVWPSATATHVLPDLES